MPWLLAGDFNDMLHYDDKIGGASPCRLKGFRKWFDDNDMIDLGFSGPKFTWSNNRVFERLDRAVCNVQWRSLFNEASVKHLPRTKSDHCPIKISLKSSFSSSPIARPFRFEAMWLTHAHFKDFLMQQWALTDGSVLDKTNALVQPLLHWNSTIFGNLRRRKSTLLARLAGVQNAMGPNTNRFLSKLENSLFEEYNEVIEQESLFWQQKSRVKWLQEGDRNTKFFHLTTLIRRRRNKIERLKDDNGEWIEGAGGLKKLAVSYFVGLFTQDQQCCTFGDLPSFFPPIEAADLANLAKNVDLIEVKVSLFNIGGLKAPGVDGFPACFFQNQWHLCGNEIYNLVDQAFRDSKLPEGAGG
ncbi:uncharacterized protein LOC110765062 [Prunus avium]|uniref:Uncharacterized protein LOC110765062 n=1 Tax=Prunus avium TaxID=42229 RepID=A0A6P5T9D1_PRUAV|nr:uncharacterized protein LOC110765062 [Prunus avium]